MLSASDFATVAVNILEEPKNGSIWLIDGGKQSEVQLTAHWRKF